MNKWQDYNDTYEQAMSQDSPASYIQKRWGNPKPYFNQFVTPLLKDKCNMMGLDIGAGFGRYTDLLNPYCRAVYAIDPSILSLNYLGTQFKNVIAITPVQSNIIKNASVDIAISFSTFLHFNKYEIWWYFNLLQRLVKPGGYVVINYMSLEGLGMITKNPPKRFGDTGRYEFHHFTFMEKVASLHEFTLISDLSPHRPIVNGHKVITCVKQ